MTDEKKKPNEAQQLVTAMTHKQVWMQIQCTNSIPQTDGKGAFVEDGKGKMVYAPNHAGWLPLRQEDIPEWIKKDAVIRELQSGTEVAQYPEDGGRWYRGIVTQKEVVNPSPAQAGVKH